MPPAVAYADRNSQRWNTPRAETCAALQTIPVGAVQSPGPYGDFTLLIFQHSLSVAHLVNPRFSNILLPHAIHCFVLFFVGIIVSLNR